MSKSYNDLMNRSVDIDAKYSIGTQRKFNLEGKAFVSCSPADVLYGQRGMDGFEIIDSEVSLGGVGPESSIRSSRVKFVSFRCSVSGDEIGVFSTTRRQFSSGLRGVVANLSQQKREDNAEAVKRQRLDAEYRELKAKWNYNIVSTVFRIETIFKNSDGGVTFKLLDRESVSFSNPSEVDGWVAKAKREQEELKRASEKALKLSIAEWEKEGWNPVFASFEIAGVRYNKFTVGTRHFIKVNDGRFQTELVTPECAMEWLKQKQSA